MTRAIFLGSKEFGLSILKCLRAADKAVDWIALHPKDQDDTRSCIASFESYCAGSGIALEIVNSDGAKDRILALAPDIVFVCGWYWLLPGDLLSSGPQFLGIHNSKLPKYRGGAPLVWALIEGERVVGSSLFALGGGMDDGRVYLQVETAVAPDDDIAGVITRIEAEYLRRLPDFWREFLKGEIVGREQDHSAATFAGQRRPEDGRIDWRWEAQRVHDFVRAQSRPYPGAFTDGPDGRIRIWRSAIRPHPYHGTPGQVLERRGDRVTIACGGSTALDIYQAESDDGESKLASLFPSRAVRL